MKTTIENSSKVQIVAAFLKESAVQEVNKTKFASVHGISPRSLSRYVEQFSEDAKQLLKAPETKKMFRTRTTGRTEMLYQIVREMGHKTKPALILAELQKRSATAGLNQVKEGAGLSMISKVRAFIRRTEQTVQF